MSSVHRENTLRHWRPLLNQIEKAADELGDWPNARWRARALSVYRALLGHQEQRLVSRHALDRLAQAQEANAREGDRCIQPIAYAPPGSTISVQTERWAVLVAKTLLSDDPLL